MGINFSRHLVPLFAAQRLHAGASEKKKEANQFFFISCYAIFMMSLH